MTTQALTDIVPLVDLVGPHRELEEELVDVFRRALRSAQFIGGPEVEGFEREFAAFCGAADCVGVANGTDALRLALTACGVGRGDAVVTVSHTFIATVEAISMAGAETEFVDIDERTYCMSPAALEEFLSSCEVDTETGHPVGKRTGLPIKAILPVHIYGQMADMEPLLEIASRYGLIVVEDACQAHGAEYQMSDGTWRRAGTIGRAAAFSFYPSKNLGACGDAGAVTTNDLEVARRIRMLREHGQSAKYLHEVEGCNSRLDAIQAAVLRVKLRHLEEANAQRRLAADGYAALLDGIDGLTLPYEPARSRSMYHLFVVRHRMRDALAEHLRGQSVTPGFHYPVPVHQQECYCAWRGHADVLPVTDAVAAETLSLPMFPGLTAEQQGRVADVMRSFGI